VDVDTAAVGDVEDRLAQPLAAGDRQAEVGVPPAERRDERRRVDVRHRHDGDVVRLGERPDRVVPAGQPANDSRREEVERLVDGVHPGVRGEPRRAEHRPPVANLVEEVRAVRGEHDARDVIATSVEHGF
jgi:hypothetical protein